MHANRTGAPFRDLIDMPADIAITENETRSAEIQARPAFPKFES
jgi:hypothetical protein